MHEKWNCSAELYRAEIDGEAMKLMDFESGAELPTPLSDVIRLRMKKLLTIFCRRLNNKRNKK